MKRYQAKMDKVSAGDMARQLRQNAKEVFITQEAAFDRKIQSVCQHIIGAGTPIILLAGPSSSGKTTTAKKLVSHLTGKGKLAHRISLDNFYKPRDELPFWEDGSTNYESVDGLDLELFHDLMQQLWGKGQADFPVFDFTLGRRGNKTFPIAYSPDTFLIFEGIHALHPKLSQALEDLPCTRIYVSVHSDFVSEDGTVLLPARQLRLTRRIIRDIVSRDSTAANTLSMWDKVLKGERLYIQPYRPTANIHINTVHGFEPFLYRDKIEAALACYPADDPYWETAADLLALYQAFSPCPGHYLSPDSLIREFFHP